MIRKLILSIIAVLISILLSASTDNRSFHFRFAVITDVHLESSAQDNPKNFKLLYQSSDLLTIAINELNSLNRDSDPDNDIDFVLFGGDNSNSRWMDDYTLLSEIIAELQIPFYMVPGDWDFSANFSPRMVNHYYSVPHDNLHEHIMFEESAMPGLRKYDYSVDIRNSRGDILHLIGMDNVCHFEGNRGSYEEQQLTWLEEDLEINNHDPVIILQHCSVLVPYSDKYNLSYEDVDWITYTLEKDRSNILPKNEYVKDIPWRKDRAADRSDEFLDIVTKYNIPLVIMGDLHLNKKCTYPEVNPHNLLTINPALVSYPCAYTIYEIDEEKITWAVIRIKKYAQLCEDYDRAGLEQYNQMMDAIGTGKFNYNVEKTLQISWGSDDGESNDWHGVFYYN